MYAFTLLSQTVDQAYKERIRVAVRRLSAQSKFCFDTARALIYSLSLRRLQAAGAEISAAGSPAAKAGGTGAKSGAGGGSGSSPKGASGLLQRIKGLAGSPSTPKAEVAPDGVSHAVVEISPLLSYQGEGLEHVRGQTLKPPVLLADSVD